MSAIFMELSVNQICTICSLFNVCCVDKFGDKTKANQKKMKIVITYDWMKQNMISLHKNGET